MHLQGLLDTDQFLIFAQLEPPKGADTSGFLRHAKSLKGRVRAVLVPEMSGGIMRMSSVGAASLLKQEGSEPIVHVHCRDRNRLALQADVLGASALGVENLFISAGDDIRSGDHIEAKPVYDLDVIGVLDMIKKVQKGTDLGGNDLLGIPQFCVGAEVNAGLQRGALEVEILEMEKKIRAGANYFFTPTIYDLTMFEQFIRKVAPFKVPVFAQLTILKSVGMARFMSRHVEGVMIPDEIFDRLGKAPDKTKEGISIALETIQKLRGFCRGVLLVAIGDEERLSVLLDQAGV
jgi:methylenetetrahydrofolate reductase (NADPH)